MFVITLLAFSACIATTFAAPSGSLKVRLLSAVSGKYIKGPASGLVSADAHVTGVNFNSCMFLFIQVY